MATRQTVIDDIDLHIPLTPALREQVLIWIGRLEEAHDHIEVTPRVKKDRLLINSTDFISLLGYIDPLEVPEIELRRLILQGKKALEQALIRSLNLDKRSHYKWCLTALSHFKPGRFL